MISRTLLVLTVTVLMEGCVLQPNEPMPDLSHQTQMNMAEEGRKNLAAIAEVTRSHGRQKSSASQPSPVKGQENEASRYLFLGPSVKRFALPQPHIVRPPESRARRSPSPVVRYPDWSTHAVPPHTVVVPSPHPGTHCSPDVLGGQRCYSQP